MFFAVEIQLAGLTFRYAEKEATINGDLFKAGLSGISLSKVVTADTDVQITITSGEKWAEIFAANGFLIDGGLATIYLDDGSERFSGVVTQTSFDQVWEPLITTIKAKTNSFKDLISPLAEVNSDTLPLATSTGYEIPKKAYGLVYPIPIGYAGYFVRSYLGTQLDVSQCSLPVPYAEYKYTTDDGHAIIAEGWVEALNVNLIVESDGTNTTTVVATHFDYDKLGRKVTYITNTGALSDGDQLYVGFHPDYGGGILYRNELMRGGSDIFEWILSTYTDMPIDKGRVNANRKQLNEFKFDLFINEPSDPMDWLESFILSFMPVKMCRSEDGYYLQPMPMYPNPIEVVLAFERGRNAERVSGLMSTNDTANEFIIQYGPNIDGEHWYGKIVFTATNRALPREVEFSAQSVVRDQLCSVAQAQNGGRIIQSTLTIPSVWDGAVASIIGKNYVLNNALPYRTITYSIPEEYIWLDIGSLVKLTDNEIPGISELICRVDDMVISSKSILVTLHPLKSTTQYL